MSAAVVTQSLVSIILYVPRMPCSTSFQLVTLAGKPGFVNLAQTLADETGMMVGEDSQSTGKPQSPREGAEFSFLDAKSYLNYHHFVNL